MLVYCSHCVYNLFIRTGNRGCWPASVKLVTLPYLTFSRRCYLLQADWSSDRVCAGSALMPETEDEAAAAAAVSPLEVIVMR